MLKITANVLMLTLCMVFTAVPPASLGQSQTSEPVTIDIDLAQFVATQHVHKYYSGFDWRAVDHMKLYDINGSVQAYAFVFAVAGSDLNTSDDLRQYIHEKSSVLKQAKEEQDNAEPETDSVEQARARVVEAEEALYNFRGVVTIITGAASDKKPILRHFRGIAEFWVNAEASNETTTISQVGMSQRIIYVAMITPMDFRLVITEAVRAEPLSTDMRSARRTIFSDTDTIFRTKTAKIQSISEMRKERQDAEDRKQQRLNTLEPAERANYEKASKGRAKALADEWQEYRQMQSRDRNEEEVAK